MFKKYESIGNSYNGYNRQLIKFPELFNAEYIIQEKIHGCNLQFAFDPGKEITICSRNQIVGYYPDRTGSFFNLSEVLPKYDNLLKIFQDFSNKINKKINIYCEYFGTGIKKEVFYGKKQIRIFDILIDSYLSPGDIFLLFKELELDFNYIVPSFGFIYGIENCLAFDIERDSLLVNRKNNIIEGIVIKPYSERLGPEFYLKKKSKAFLERAGKAKKIRTVNPEIQEIQMEFLKYITEARMQNIFSNYGSIEDIAQLGTYICYIIQDAKKDFLEDHEGFSMKEHKKAFNVSKDIVKMLKEYLSQNI